MSCGINLRATSLEVIMIWATKNNFKISHLKLLPQFPVITLKRTVMLSCLFFVVSPNKLLNKQTTDLRHMRRMTSLEWPWTVSFCAVHVFFPKTSCAQIIFLQWCLLESVEPFQCSFFSNSIVVVDIYASLFRYCGQLWVTDYFQ